MLFTHGGNDRDKEVLAVIEASADFLTKSTLGDLNVILRAAIVGHQVEEALINVDLGQVGLPP